MISNNSNYNPEIDLSIVVPVYNEEQLVAKNITEIINVFSNKQIEFEIIIVDDCSSDDSLTICKKIQNKFDSIIHILCNQQNRGYTSAIKRGIEFSRGEYISYLDVDLQYDPQDLLLFYFIATTHLKCVTSMMALKLLTLFDLLSLI